MSTFSALNNVVGVLLAVSMGLIFAKCMHDFHETSLWFSNIEEMERRISLRTESGFYASFFYQIVETRSLKTGLRKLIYDRKSEFPYVINSLERFNIYPEVSLGVFYRFLSAFWPFQLPIPTLFYAYFCFLNSGLAVTATFFLAWTIGSEWIYGLMASTWMIVNYEEVSRVNFALNMREIFALPWLWFQILFVIRVLRQSKTSAFGLVLISLFTFLFSICWQFSQYVCLFQSASLLMVSILSPQLTSVIRRILLSQTVGFCLGIVVQFFQPMLLVASILWFNLSVAIVFSFFPQRTFTLKSAFVRLLSIFVLFVGFVFASKFVVKADTHIWHFFLSKFGLSIDNPPFETLVYLCHGAFSFLGYDFVERTTRNGVIQMFGVSLILFVVTVVYRFCKVRQLPPSTELYLNVQTLLFGIMTYTTLRMKYILFPHMSILASCAFGYFDRFVGRYVKYAVILSLAAKISFDHYQFYQKVMSHEQEFYDPDTVKLMEFINKESGKNVYAGSMQLLAGVKCCTNRAITNHPHFEDKRLRDRTFRIYQMYARAPFDHVHEVLKSEKATHIIVENSICYAKSNGCALKDVIDVANGQRTESDRTPPSVSSANLQTSSHDRFCDALKNPRNGSFPVLVFENRTFRVYRLEP